MPRGTLPGNPGTVTEVSSNSSTQRLPSGKAELYSSRLESQGIDPLPQYVSPKEGPNGDQELFARYLAQGYMRYRNGRRVPPDSEDSEGNVAQVQESEAFTEKRLDFSGHRSLHSFTS